MPDISTRRIQKSPRGAGVFGRIGASTRSAANTLAGDFINDCYIGATSMHAHSSARPRVCLPPVRLSSALAFRLGGVA